MKNLKRVCVFTISGAALIATIQAASAQTITPTLVNNTGLPVTISNIYWTGSYLPRIEGTIPANSAPVSGSHRMADPTVERYTDLSFKASFTYQGDLKTCNFYYSFRSDSGAFVYSGASRVAGDPIPGCKVAQTSSYRFTFTIATPSQ